MQGHIRLRIARWSALVAVLGALALSSAPALAAGECDGAPGTCVTVSAQVDLDKSGTESRDLSCPDTYKYYWDHDWNTSSAAVSVAFASNSNITLPGSASFTATNWNPFNGGWAVFLIGCVQVDPGDARPPADRPGSPLFEPQREPQQTDYRR